MNINISNRSNISSNSINSKMVFSKINFDKILSLIRPIETYGLNHYFQEIWKDLSDLGTEEKGKNFTILKLMNYYNIPYIMALRLFNLFKKQKTKIVQNSNNYLTREEFTKGMLALFTGNYKQLIKFIFDFYDFNNDLKINRKDIEIIFEFIPLRSNSLYHNFKFKYELDNLDDLIESKNEIISTLNKIFEKKEFIDETFFKYSIENINSDVFIFLLIFLYQNKPFTTETIIYYQRTYYKSTSSQNIPNEELSSQRSNITEGKLKLIMNPTTNSKFSPSTVLKKFDKSTQKELLRYKSLTNLNKFINQKIKIKHTRTFQRDNIKTIINEEENEDLKNSIDSNSKFHPNNNNNNDNSKHFLNIKSTNTITTTKFYNFKKNITKNTNSNKDYNNSIEELNSINYNNNNNSLNYTETKELEDNHNLYNNEGFLYKININKKPKKMFFKLIYKDFFFYKIDNESNHAGVHNLNGVFLKEEDMVQIENVTYFSFSLVYTKKERKYYTDNIKEYDKWIKCLRNATDYKDINQIYDIKEKIGLGRYGLIKLGYHIEKKRTVAIKMFNKKEMKYEQYLEVKNEIEILKVTKHKNIIQIYDVIENEDNIYIIMEYYKGGDLLSFMEKRKYKISEIFAANIIYKLTFALIYLKEHNIIHRDIKPENILMTNNNDDSEPILFDFCLAKIFKENDNLKNPIGTIGYIAPEILLNNNYSYKSEVYNIGVISYFLLTGYMPLNFELSDKDIIKQTLYTEINYPNELWKNINPDAKNFVANCLIKIPEKRYDLEDIINDEWIYQSNC